jgi:hypothetical protein
MSFPFVTSHALTARGRESVRPLGANFLLLGVVAALLVCGPHRAGAQGAGGAATSDVMQLINDLDDIDAMRPVVPLKITPEQLDKIIATLTTAQASYDRKLKAIAGPALAKLADQIRDVKQKTLKGEPIPKDFDLVAKQAEIEIVGKRKALDLDTLGSVATSLESILTPDQVKIAAKLDRDAQIKLGKATANTERTESQWFGSYVKDAIMTVPRIIPVLKQMRGTDSKTAAAGGGNK